MENFTSKLCQRVDLLDVSSCDTKTDQGSLISEVDRKISIRAALIPLIERLDKAVCANVFLLLLAALVCGLFICLFS